MLESHADYLVRRAEAGVGLAKLTEFPRYFEIETVNACQAKCPMCTIADWNRKDGVMADDLFEKIAAEIEQHSDEIKKVRLYRDGEPLLDKKLATRIARMKRAGVKDVGISTNAELLTQDIAAAILNAGLDEIILSIDSVHKETYDAIRVGLNFDRVLTRAQAFFHVRNYWGSPCRIRVRMIRQESNAKEWESGEFNAFWRGLATGNDTIECRDIHNWGGALADWKPVNGGADTSRPCVALWSLMTVFADGSVPLCNVDYNNRFPIGNVRDSSIAELWQSHEQNRRRDLHMSGNRSMIAPCAKCTVWSEGASHH